MKYSQVFEKTIKEEIIEKEKLPELMIKEVKGIIPPIRNKQKWFVIRKQDQTNEVKERFEDVIEKVIYFLQLIQFPFFPVFEWERVLDESGLTKYYSLESVYFLDFNIPIDEAYKFSNPSWTPAPHEHRDMLSIYRGRYLPGMLTIYNVPVVYYLRYVGKPLVAHVKFEDIKKTIQEGHFLAFTLGDENRVSLFFDFPSRVIFNLRPNANYFFYTKGKIRHSVRKIFGTTEYAIDNFFLSKFEKVLPLMLSILTQFPEAFGVTFSESKIFLEIKTRLGTIYISFKIFIRTLEITGCYIIFWYKMLQNKYDFLYGIESIAKYMWLKIFGEEIAFSDDLDIKLKEMEDRMIFLKEALGFVE